MRAWLDLAEARGYRRVAVWGHSLGAVKTVYFLGTDDDPRVVCAVASSPPRFSYQAYHASADAARFDADIDRARQAVAAGQPDEMIEVRIPVARPFSARTYLDKYGPDARYDYFDYLPKVRQPLLLTLGSLEAGNLNFAPLAEHGPGFSARWPGVAFSLIQGADHSYTDRTDGLWSAVADWLARAARPVVSTRG
jgi:pimeloyl-ACP methyl ester carboxylesterase